MSRATLVLTAAPGSGQVTDALIAAVRLSISGEATGAARWLALGDAWEIELDAPAETFARVRATVEAALREVAVDVNVVGGGRSRAKRLLAADMESTIIEQELIDEIGALAGRREEIARITAATMRGEHDFAQSLIARVALFEGLEVARLLALLERATLTPGALTLVRTMAAGGAATALVSGGFTLFAEPIAARVGFDHVSANVLEVANGRLTGRVRMPILDAAGKSDTLVRLARERGIGLDETLAVGDGANDLAMIRTAGLGVAFRPKPMLAQAARSSKGGAVVAHGDLTAVLNLQGYAQEAFRG